MPHAAPERGATTTLWLDRIWHKDIQKKDGKDNDLAILFIVYSWSYYSFLHLFHIDSSSIDIFKSLLFYSCLFFHKCNHEILAFTHILSGRCNGEGVVFLKHIQTTA